MPNYLTPGVYVEEVPSGSHQIQGRSTSTAVFIGTGGKDDAPIGIPTAITNWSQYESQFMAKGPMTPLSLAVRGFFDNTQGRCYILDVGPGGSLSGTPQRPGLSVLEEIEEIKIVCAPGYTTPADFEALLSHCKLMSNRMAILDGPRDVVDVMSLTRVATMEATPAAADAPAAAAADGEPAPPRARRQQQENNGAPPSAEAAMYWPWVLVKDLSTGDTVLAPPSGHMAGIWARTDATRGVHKAPANEPLRGVVGVQRRVTPSEQGELNSAGVNVIRLFDRIGIRAWGARTLARDTEPQWTYINVRRLFLMAEEAIAQGTSWIVFEPNNRPLWNMIIRDVSDFLTGLWKDGALMGSTPEEAFYVKCDEETNSPDVVDAGRLVAEIGMAPVKPAEFIVFKVSQFSGGTITEEGSSRG